jgi:hypothetical protein
MSAMENNGCRREYENIELDKRPLTRRSPASLIKGCSTRRLLLLEIASGIAVANSFRQPEDLRSVQF